MLLKFKEWLQQESAKAIDYKPGALIPSAIERKGGPGKLNPFCAQLPSRPVKPTYTPIFRAGKGPKQKASTIVNH